MSCPTRRDPTYDRSQGSSHASGARLYPNLEEFYGLTSGHIKIYSEPGEGTTVRLYFPRVTRAQALDDVDNVQPLPGSAKPGEVVLVVEDHDDVRTSTTQMLRDLGYTVRAVSEGGTPLAVVSTEPRSSFLLRISGCPDLTPAAASLTKRASAAPTSRFYSQWGMLAVR